MDRDNTSVMSKVTATLGRNFIRSKEFQEAQMMGLDTEAILNKQKPRSIRHKLVSLTLKRKNKLGEDVRRKLQVINIFLFITFFPKFTFSSFFFL